MEPLVMAPKQKNMEVYNAWTLEAKVSDNFGPRPSQIFELRRVMPKLGVTVILVAILLSVRFGH